MSESTKRRGRWVAGQSGNPKGRLPGAGEVQKLRAAINEQVPEIIDQLVNNALNGDVQAAKLLLERVLPPLKAVEQGRVIQMPEEGSLTEQARAVLLAIGKGEIGTGQGAQLLAAIATLGKSAEIDELARRVASLEKLHEKD